MDSIAVTKPNMAVLSQERLALSPFGALAQSFAEVLMARAGQEEGYWSFVPLELLQEAEEPPVSPVPPAQTVLQFNLKLVLDALRKDRPNTEYLRATERIVERIVQRQEVQREAARSAPTAAAVVAPAATAQAALRFQQNIMQTLHQTFLFQRPDGYRTGEGFRQQPGAAAGETGRPGQLGQKTAVFTQMLQTLREEGKSFPAQQAAETAQQGGAQAAKRLIQTAEQLERKLRQKDVRPTKTQTIQQTQHTPVSQHTGPEQGHDLPKFSARQGGEPTGSLHTLEPPSLKEQSEISRAVERAVRTAETLLPQMEPQRQTSAKPLTEQPPGKEARTVTAKDIRTVIPDSDNQESRPEQHRADFLPSEELTHRQEEPGREATAPPAAMTQPHSAQPHIEAGQKVTARDIRTVISESGEQATQPEQRMGELLPGEELTHRQEEPGSEATTPPTAMTQPHSVQPHVEAGQKVTARDIRTVIPESGEQAAQPERRLGELLPGEELIHRQEEQSREAATPHTAMLQPHSAQPHAEPGQRVTARDIRIAIPESGEQATQPEQRLGELLPGEELTHRQEEQSREAATPHTAMLQPHSAQPHAEPGQRVTARDIRIAIPESGEQATQPEQRLGKLLPSEELTHRQEEQSRDTATPPRAMIQPVPVQPHTEPGQKVTARDIRTVIPESGEQATQPEQRMGELLPGEELTHRQEEQGGETPTPPTAMTHPHSAQPHGELGQQVTARDIRTVIPETGEPVTQPEQRMGELLPGEELTHRQEEPGREEATPPTAMLQPHSAQPHVEPGQKVTARDIRTVPSNSGEQIVRLEQRQVEFPSDIELAHRAEEQKDEATQAAAQSQPHTAKEIHSAAGAGVTAQENRQYKRKVKGLSSLETDSQKEKETNQTEQISEVSGSAGKTQPTTARDIRTAVIGFAGREGNRERSKVKALSGDELIHRLEGQSEEYLQPSVASRTMETQLAQGTLSGEELTLKTEQSTAAPPPAEAFERATVGQQVSVGKPIAGTLQGDIRIGQRLMGRSNLLPETGNRRDIPSAAVPSVALEYGTHVQGQQGEQPPVPAQNDARRAGNTANQQPLELTYSPGQQAVSQVQPPVQPQAPQPPEESDSVRSLPDWARRFLRDSWTAAPAAQEIGVARQIATLPEQSTEMVEWSAPNYKPNVPLEHREKRKEERPQKPQQIHLSEAEIQRAADRVYRILEDRIREERIRLGF